MHIHDEMVVEVPEATAELALSDISYVMGQPIPWAPGLLLRADGYTTKYYKKD
jgi:DNA polymerase